MGYDVFISFKRGALDGSGLTRDYALASDLHKTLLANGINAFFSEKDLSTSAFRDEIDDALDDAQILIAVGTSRENLESQNVKYEWRSFYDDVLGGYKPNGEIYTYLEGMSQAQLPRALRQRQSFSSDQKDTLVKWVKRNLAEMNPQPKTQPKPQPQPKPHEQLKSQPTPAPRLNVRVGDKVQFGQYPQGAKGEVMPLEWRVLDVQDGKALLLTDKLVDCKPYNERLVDVTWETCTLRKWLNNDFINKAFGSGQQSQIALVTNQNPDNPRYGTNGGNATQDKIFALSIDEVKKYFSSDSAMEGYATPYAVKNGAYVDKDDGGSWWWLRSPGYRSGSAANVLAGGGVLYLGGDVLDYGVAIRPALWLNL